MCSNPVTVAKFMVVMMTRWCYRQLHMSECDCTVASQPLKTIKKKKKHALINTEFGHLSHHTSQSTLTLCECVCVLCFLGMLLRRAVSNNRFCQ